MYADADSDTGRELCEQIRSAAAERRPLLITGGGSKLSLLGRRCDAERLSVGGHRGIVSLKTDELVVTVRAGTTVRELVDSCAEKRLILPFEPPLLGGRATVGGTLACALSGPARPWRGSTRDALLGLRLINGRGELLRFGGEVMKNVAGYDVSRLQAGALGTLGVITELSLRLLPSPEARLYLRRPASAIDALRTLRELAAQPLPLSGAGWADDHLQLRFEGSVAALAEVSRRLSEYEKTDETHWARLREWDLEPLRSGGALWVLDTAPAAPLDADHPCLLFDWGGARRFVSTAAPDDAIHELARSARGHAQLYGAGATLQTVIAEPPPALKTLHRRVKQALDPEGIFNPGRLHAWL